MPKQRRSAWSPPWLAWTSCEQRGRAWRQLGNPWGCSIFNSSNGGRHFHLFFSLSFSRSLIALIALGPAALHGQETSRNSVASKRVGLSDQCPTPCGRRPCHGQSRLASFATLDRSAQGSLFVGFSLGSCCFCRASFSTRFSNILDHWHYIAFGDHSRWFRKL